MSKLVRAVFGDLAARSWSADMSKTFRGKVSEYVLNVVISGSEVGILAGEKTLFRATFTALTAVFRLGHRLLVLLRRGMRPDQQSDLHRKPVRAESEGGDGIACCRRALRIIA
jgi:hypothetical protein